MEKPSRRGKVVYDTHCPEQRGRRHGAVLSPVSKPPLTGHSAPALLNQQGRDAPSGRGKERGAADNRAHRSLGPDPVRDGGRTARGQAAERQGPQTGFGRRGCPASQASTAELESQPTAEMGHLGRVTVWQETSPGVRLLV